MENKNVRPFGFKDKFSYMVGNMGNDLMFLLASMYLLKFYTDVMGVSAALVGSMMMVARFIDAFTDVTMGQIVDRAPTKAKGKFAPFLKMVAGPVTVASFLMYAVWFKDMNMTFKVIWMFVTYILWGSVFYTGINIPYGSMASAITAEPAERAALSNWRTIGTQFVVILTGVILPTFLYKTVEANGVVTKAFSGQTLMIVAGIFSVLSFICFMVCHHMTTERVKFEQKSEKFKLSDITSVIVGNRALIGILVVSIFILLGQFCVSGMQNYIYPGYFNSSSAISMVNMIAIITTFACAPFVVTLSKKFGRKALTIVASILQCVPFAILYFLHTTNVNVFLGFMVINSLGAGLMNLIIWAMISDVIDDTEVVKGIRADGTVYSIYSFARKCGQGFASGLTGALLSMVGYTAATSNVPEVLDGIYNVSCLAPAIFFGILIVLTIVVYPLDKKRVEENTAELARRRGVA